MVGIHKKGEVKKPKEEYICQGRNQKLCSQTRSEAEGIKSASKKKNSK